VVDGPYLAGAVATLCRVFGDVFFCFLFGTAGWMLIIYKEQDDIYVMLPISEGPNTSSLAVVFRQILIAVFVAKCVHIVELVYSQTRHDIFLIDWEQPRDSRDGDAESGGDARGRGSSVHRPVANTAAGSDPSHGVSTWRTVFVANEWAQLQSARSISLEVSLVFLLFFQQGLGLEDFSRLTPAGTGAPGIPHDLFLRFALSSFLLLALALVQWLARWAFWDRFVQDRVWQFVDLLAVTNISCLLFQEQTYGYYLHGRSVHEHTDTDMLQVNRNLKREEDGLSAKRGLLKDSDTQSFEIFISREVRERYDRAIRGAGQLVAARAGRSAQRDPRRRGFASSPEDLLLRQRETNEFLTAFVSGTLERETLRVREKQYWERLINLPPEIAPNTRESIFLADPAGERLCYGSQPDDRWGAVVMGKGDGKPRALPIFPRLLHSRALSPHIPHPQAPSSGFCSPAGNSTWSSFTPPFTPSSMCASRTPSSPSSPLTSLTSLYGGCATTWRYATSRARRSSTRASSSKPVRQHASS
jgi:meckelin